MKVLNLFPLSVVQDKILIDQKIKKDMNNEIREMLLNSKNKEFKGALSKLILTIKSI